MNLIPLSPAHAKALSDGKNITMPVADAKKVIAYTRGLEAEAEQLRKNIEIERQEFENLSGQYKGIISTDEQIIGELRQSNLILRDEIISKDIDIKNKDAEKIAAVKVERKHGTKKFWNGVGIGVASVLGVAAIKAIIQS